MALGESFPLQILGSLLGISGGLLILRVNTSLSFGPDVKLKFGYGCGQNVTGRSSRYRRRNIELVQEYVHKFSEAKDFSDALRVQTEYMQSQFAVFGEQTKTLSEAYGKSAVRVFNSSFKNVA